MHYLLQVIAASLLFWLWTFVIFNGFTGGVIVAYQHYFIYWMLVGLGLLIDGLRPSEAKTDFLNLDLTRNCTISFRQTVTVLLVILFFLVASKDLAISRIFLFTFIPPLFFLFLYSNDTFPPFLAKFVFTGKYLQNTILLGPPDSIAKLNTWLSRKSSYGVRTVGFVTDEPGFKPVGSLPCLGSSADLETHIVKANATHVIAVGLLGNIKKINKLADICHRLGVRLLVANDYEGALGRKVTLVEDDGIHFIGFHREPLESPFNRALKRIMDLAIALPAVLLVLPVLSVVVWLLQRWQSPGPLFFRQLRTGMQDEEFLMYKFRTMHLHNPDEAQQAQVDDKRVFPAGRWLRKLSLDEIPQFINVIKGEMSVVGPRPHLRAHDEIFRKVMNVYRVRAFIKPGITGLAQVRDHRGETKTEQEMIERVQSDLDYLENWSFLLDVIIVTRTIWKVLCPPKASY